METLWKDMKFSVRQLRKSPGYALAAVLTLGLGIGGISAVFSVVSAVLIEPLPYRDPDRLDLIRITLGEARYLASISAPELIDFREQSALYEDFGASWIGSGILVFEDGAERVTSGWATANFFSVLGVDLLMGRSFTAEEEKPEGPGAVILSHGLWHRRFGGDPQILGKVVEMGGPRTVVGVLPPDFQLLRRLSGSIAHAPDLWEPNTYWTDRDVHWLQVIGRRNPGVTLEQAQAEMDSISARLSREYQEYAAAGVQFHVVPQLEDLVSGVRPALWSLLGTVAFLLLIACANVASMSLVRTSRRSGELSVRTALGASRLRVTGQLLTESGLIAVLGAGLGLAFAYLGLEVLAALRPAQLPRLDDIEVDLAVFAFTAAVSLLTLLASGLPTAFQASRVDLNYGLRGESGRSFSGRQRDRLLNAIVVVEVTFALVLLIGAGLLIRSFLNLRAVEIGFNAERLLAFSISLPRTYDTAQERLRFLETLGEDLEGLPGVTGFSGASRLPFADGFESGHYAFDAESSAAWGRHEAEYRWVMRGFFDVLGAEVVAGRAFGSEDLVEGRRVAVIDEDLARSAWPGQNPLGQQVMAGANREWHDVVGVVRHIRQLDLRSEERPQIYFPFAGQLFDLSLVVRADVDPATLVPLVTERVRQIDASVPISNLRPLPDYVADARADTRFVLILMSMFAGVALILTGVGLFATISFWVVERLPEIGVRIAIGAERGDVLTLVLRRGLVLTAAGLAAGLLVTVALTGSLRSLLFHVDPTDPWTISGLLTGLLAIAVLACLVPAWRASLTDPAKTLRNG
jgi:putative ABC transport system permease protein